MAYLSSLLVAAAAIVVLLVLLVRLVGPVRRAGRTARLTRAGITERTGLLSARIAALRMELARRRRPPGSGSTGGHIAA